MLHLLTEEQRKKVVNEYRKRIVVTIFLGVFFAALITIVFALPSFVLSYTKYVSFLNKKEDLNSKLTTSTGNDAAENIKNITLAMESLKMYEHTWKMSTLLEGVVKEKPQGIQIKNIIFTPNESGVVAIDLSGRSNTRQSLVTYNKLLKENSIFNDVIIPLASFAKEKDIDFSIKILVNAPSKTISSEPITQNTHDEKQI